MKARLLNMTWSNLRFNAMAKNLFNSIFGTTPEVSTKRYFVEIS